MPIYTMEGKKDGLQKYRVRINYKDSNGDPKQIDRIVFGLETAKDVESDLLKDIQESPPVSRMTVQALYNEYIESKKHEIREASLKTCRDSLTNHVLSTLKDKKLSALTIQVLEKWKTEIDEKDLAFFTKQSIFDQFRAMLNYAVKFEYMQNNTLSHIGNFKNAAKAKNELNFYTAEEFLKFSRVAKEKAEKKEGLYEWNYYVFFNIAFYTGLRKGEIQALKWRDIEGDILHVRRSLSQKLGGGDRETPPKNLTSFRSLQMPDPLRKILDEHYDKYKKAERFSHDWRVCGGVEPLRDSTLQKRNIELSKTADIKQIRIHDFRHSHVILLANEGINIQEIARRLGNAKIEETWNTYAHLYPREEERAVQILNKIV